MVVPRPTALLAFVLSFGLPVIAALDRGALAEQYFGNDAPWYLDRIPFFESSDANLTEVYYYRWNIFRAHQRDLGAQGYITTELYVFWFMYLVFSAGGCPSMHPAPFFCLETGSILILH